ncbi:MAG: hypothetical protein R3D55_01490 [Chloroflexota bacterium]
MQFETITYQEQLSFRLSTRRYTAVYHQEGCGLAALFDADGSDWISYRPSGGEYGHYRGIPNMGLDAFGHPGYAFGATTMVSLQTAERMQLFSSSADGRWQTVWDFYPQKLVQTITAVAAPYWWLYEGTVGGRFQPERQHLILPDGQIHPASQRYTANAEAKRSVTFVDPASGRGLQLTAHTPEPTVDLYWPMGGDGGMTVWGFGRHDDETGPHPHLTQTPATFSVAFVEKDEG